MSKIAVVYWSGTGNTEAMANAVFEGAKSKAEASLFTAGEFSADKMDEFDAVLFGSYGWGDGEWMRNWEADCKAAGAVMPAGFVICNEAPDAEAIEACKALGAALA